MTNQMSWPQPRFNLLIPTQLECIDKLLLLLVMLIGYVDYHVNLTVDCSQD